jgi:hypothetical protein
MKFKDECKENGKILQRVETFMETIPQTVTSKTIVCNDAYPVWHSYRLMRIPNPTGENNSAGALYYGDYSHQMDNANLLVFSMQPGSDLEKAIVARIGNIPEKMDNFLKVPYLCFYEGRNGEKTQTGPLLEGMEEQIEAWFDLKFRAETPQRNNIRSEEFGPSCYDRISRYTLDRFLQRARI